MSNRSYQYRPLDTDRASIRLIKLQPGQTIDALHCEIEHVSLQDSPIYDALSYSWGISADDIDLISPEGSFKIRQSIEQALKQLRHPGTQRRLWIDVVCINQGDSTEKGQQVQMMHRIYSQAATTVAWLGLEDEFTSPAFKMISELHEKMEMWSKDVVHTLPKGKKSVDLYLELMGIPPRGDLGWKALSLLLCRPYWQRVWTLQEYAVSTNLMVACGPHSCSSHLFGGLLTLDSWLQDMAEHLPERDAFARQYSVDWGYIKRLCVAPEPYSEMYKQLGIVDEPIEAAMYTILLKWRPSIPWLATWQPESTMTLFELLYRTRSRQATDSRDKVFSVLNLVRDKTARLPTVDYTRDVAKVYTETARCIMLKDRNLDLLAAVDYSDFSKRLPGMPSWIPNWGEVLKEPSNSFSHMGFSSATGNFISTGSSKCDPKFILLPTSDDSNKNHRSISLCGIKDAIIVNVKHIPIHGERNWYKFQKLSQLLEEEAPELVTSQLLFSVWEAMEEEGHKARPFPIMGGGRSMFLTTRGTVGIGPRAMRRGDIVYLIMGGNVPYILRPVVTAEKASTNDKDVKESSRDETLERKQIFELVGECYVPDLMYGEGLIWARAKKQPELMLNNLGPGYEEDRWLRSLGSSNFPFDTQELTLV